MKNIEEIFIKQKGYARMSDLKSEKIHTRSVAKAIENGIIEKVKAGLYKLVDYPWDEHSSFVDISQSKKSAIICLTSALAYHELSTINPSIVTIAVPQNTDQFILEYPPVKVYYFSNNVYSLGILEKSTTSGIFRIYDAEKTICDMFRYRNKLGEDIALEGLKNYLKRQSFDLFKFREYAKKSRVLKIIDPYLKAMLV